VPFQLANLQELEREHDRLLAENERAIEGSLELAGRHGVEHVQQHPEFKPRTGALQKATKYRVVRTSGGRILKLTNTKDYAAAIDTGARAHTIVPRRGKFLRFIGRDGRTVFTRRVNHPGNKPYRFMFFATDAADRVFRQVIVRRMGALASRF
jgi:hypothetical protein